MRLGSNLMPDGATANRDRASGMGDEEERMNDGEMPPLSVMDRVKAPGTIKVVVLCHPRPFAGHWQENVIRQRTEELFADCL